MAKFFNYRDIDLKINDQVFYASQVSVGANASVEPVVLSDGTLFNYAPTSAIVGNLSCDFYLTSSLPTFLDPVNIGESAVKISFAGAEIKQAFCTSLSFSVEPFQPVVISAEFDWHGDFKVDTFEEQSNTNRTSGS